MKDLDGWERIRLQLARSGKESSYAQQKKNYRDPSKSVRFEREKTMQRDIDEVETLLDLFAEDMRRPVNDVQGYPSEASGGFVATWCKDTEEAAASADAETLIKIHAAYDSLSRRYKDAINKHYKLGANVWKFDNPATFDEAKIVIRVKFVMKGLL